MKIETFTHGNLTISVPISQAFYKEVMGEWSIAEEYLSPLLEDPVVGVSYYEAINFCMRLNEIYEQAPTYLMFGDGTIALYNPKGVRLLTKEEFEMTGLLTDKHSEWVFGGETVGSGPLWFRVCMAD